MEESSTQEVSHHCVVPDWNLPTRHQGQSLTHVQFQPGLSTATPPFHFPQQMHIAAEMGARHGHDTNAVHLLPPMPMPMASPVKPRWGSSDTLESIVRQATHRVVGQPMPEDNSQSRLRSCTEKHRKATRIIPGAMPMSQVGTRKRNCTSERVLRRKNTCLSSGTCASGSSTFNMREDDSNTLMTTKLTEEDDASQDESGSKDEEAEARGGTGRTSRYSRQSKTAVTTKTHNLSERRRRDRINEKMKALQKMVPNSSKTDKASMLDEVIVYMKQLQAQVEMMKIMRSSAATTDDDNVNVNVPQMMMTMPSPTALPPQQQLQMSLLARMGVGLGLGMLGHANATTGNNAFVAPTVPQPPFPPHFLIPQMIPAATFTSGHLNPNVGGPLAPMPMHDPYAAFLARKISLDNYYNKLAALHQQRIRHHPIRSDKAQRQ